jgi:hypothetical protein
MRTNDESSKIRDAVNYLFGRFELEAEYYCHAKGLNSLDITPLVGAALVGQTMDHVPALRSTPRSAHSPAPEVEVAVGTHNRRASASAKHASRKTAAGKVIGRPAKKRAHKWSAEQRKKFIATMKAKSKAK